MNNNSLDGGFSLVELLVSIAIIGILLIVAIPHMNSVLARMESKKITVILKTTIQNAKLQAYVHRQRIGICGSIDGQICDHAHWKDGLLIFNDSIIYNRLKDPEENIINYIPLDLKYGALQWHGVGVNGNILFQEDRGLPRGSNGSFHYCSQFPEHHQRITLSYMGHISFNKTAPNC